MALEKVNSLHLLNSLSGRGVLAPSDAVSGWNGNGKGRKTII